MAVSQIQIVGSKRKFGSCSLYGYTEHGMLRYRTILVRKSLKRNLVLERNLLSPTLASLKRKFLLFHFVHNEINKRIFLITGKYICILLFVIHLFRFL
jgi:hypothetical protein